MADHHHNRFLVLAREEDFSKLLAARVIPRPELNVWMILIPVIFVFHFFKLNKMIQGRKDFSEYYMIPRRQTMDELCQALDEGRDIDLRRMTDFSNVPQAARNEYQQWISHLQTHYRDLLKAKGDSFDELVHAVYSKRGNYMNFLRKQNDLERALNKALQPKGEEAVDSREAIASIEKATAELRKIEAERIFS